MAIVPKGAPQAGARPMTATLKVMYDSHGYRRGRHERIRPGLCARQTTLKGTPFGEQPRNEPAGRSIARQLLHRPAGWRIDGLLIGSDHPEEYPCKMRGLHLMPELGASPFAGAPVVLYPNIGCKVEDRFFDQAVLAARPPEIRCPHRQGIRLPYALLDVFSKFTSLE